MSVVFRCSCRKWNNNNNDNNDTTINKNNNKNKYKILPMIIKLFCIGCISLIIMNDMMISISSVHCFNTKVVTKSMTTTTRIISPRWLLLLGSSTASTVVTTNSNNFRNDHLNSFLWNSNKYDSSTSSSRGFGCCQNKRTTTTTTAAVAFLMSRHNVQKQQQYRHRCTVLHNSFLLNGVTLHNDDNIVHGSSSSSHHSRNNHHRGGGTRHYVPPTTPTMRTTTRKTMFQSVSSTTTNSNTESDSFGYTTTKTTTTDQQEQKVEQELDKEKNDQKKSDEKRFYQDILYRIRECHNIPMNIRSTLLEFKVPSIPPPPSQQNQNQDQSQSPFISVGLVRPSIAKLLCSLRILVEEEKEEKSGMQSSSNQPVFCLIKTSRVDNDDDTTNNEKGDNSHENNKNDSTYYYLTFTDVAGTTYESRTNAVGQIMEQVLLLSLSSSEDDGDDDNNHVNNNNSNTIHTTIQSIQKGWRNELLSIRANRYDEPLFAMERAAVPLLGAIEYGVHINGIVTSSSPDNKNNNNNNKDESTNNVGVVTTVPQHVDWKLWIGRRSYNKSKYPGMLDHIVAGGQPHGLSLYENVCKECYEEAMIPTECIINNQYPLRSTGVITYQSYQPTTDLIQQIVLFNYDLFLPPTFVPQPVDGEVLEFTLLPIQDVMQLLDKNCIDPMKPNCYMVIIHFLMRHGYLSPDVPGYLDIVRELQSGICQ